jgi:sialic acid synthase SpsE
MVNIGGVAVGDGHPCFITFEAGPTHQGLESAKRLAKHARDGGANAIKFQTFDPLRLVADPQLPFSYEVLVDRDTGATETVTEPLRDILVRRRMSEQEWRDLKRYCDEIGIAFFATVGFHEDVDLLIEIGCPSIKIASADVNHFPLIRYVARTGVCVQLDTGMSSIVEIESAVDLIRAEGNENIIIHQCPSGYPARLESIHLNVIPTLKRLIGCPIAYSDHTPGWEMDVAAVALGANLVEKTVTEDRATRSVEHVMSLEPLDVARFVRVIRDVETALGSARRALSGHDRTRRNAVRRSLFAARDLPAEHLLSEADIDYRRPGFGISADRADEVIGRRLRASVKQGSPLKWEDLTA